jgi:UDP-N-acetylglucosamine 2-epimerase (non-hydrolysing)
MSFKILTLIGTRPEIIKMSAILPLLDEQFDHVLVHSGQHYSYGMDAVFFAELELRAPDHKLEVGSVPPAAQVGRIMERFEQIVLECEPCAVVVQGDTNTTLAGALVAAKYRHTGLKLLHVEAGTRSGIAHQPEEVNRTLVDRVSDLLLVPYGPDREALAAEGIAGDHVIVTGSTVFDSCMRMAELLDGSDLAAQHGLEAGRYVLATFHRQETVDQRSTLEGVVSALRRLASRLPVLVPIHPRTRKCLSQFGLSLDHENIVVTEPVGYRAFVGLLKNARFCLTDSGGIQEEAAFLRVPSVVVREKTEHRRYVDAGMHVLTGTDAHRIEQAAMPLAENDEELARRRSVPVDFEVGVAGRVVGEIEAYLKRTAEKPMGIHR